MFSIRNGTFAAVLACMLLLSIGSPANTRRSLEATQAQPAGRLAPGPQPQPAGACARGGPIAPMPLLSRGMPVHSGDRDQLPRPDRRQILRRLGAAGLHA